MNSRTHLDPDALPPYPRLWARWTATAAASAAAGDQWGPRVLPRLAWFDNGSGGGSVLRVLPGGTAAWWGEVTAGDTPGAPAIPFGYWWQSGRWHLSEPLALAHRAPAIPRVWSTGETVDTVTGLLDDERRRATAAMLVYAAEAGSVTPALVAEVFGAPGLDPEAAAGQLTLGGLLTGPRRVPHDPRRTSPGADIDGLPADGVCEAGGLIPARR
ncbi:hypothetical protein [Nocardia sp. NPDC024068]|uniref:hypothetical protein n=1 Tax=Nocardia sp. NPDC024068 TaxID=3157197 RepID=UPI0033E34D2F